MSSPEKSRARQGRVYEHLRASGVEAGVVVDLAGHRDPSMRYLCGHPQDALLFLFAEGRSLLLPWDVALAEKLACADRLEPFERFGRSEEAAIRQILEDAGVASAELPGTLAYPLVEALKAGLPRVSLHCRVGGLAETLRQWRAVKDEEEIASLRRACGITDSLLAEVEKLLLDGPGPVREVDLALLLEREARERGAEALGFETLAAGPGRSFAIHCFPTFTAGPFGGRGFSILDFGVVVDGYTSDVTVTAVRGPLSPRQEEMLRAARGAYELAASLCRPGVDPVEVAKAVDEFITGRGLHMPHALGHGLGMEPHEVPFFRTRRVPGSLPSLGAGMVFTLEPGVYIPEAGGVRLENDFLCTSSGVEALTSARLLRL